MATRARILADYVSSGDELALKAPLISPALVTPNLGTPSAGVMTNMTGAVTASIVDDAVTLAKMAHGADGSLITYSASTVPELVAPGTTGHVLTSRGDASTPTFQAAPAGGLTEADTWRLTTTFSMSSNETLYPDYWEREDTNANGLLGTGITEDGGVFSFPSTGFWLVQFHLRGYLQSGTPIDRYISAAIQVTTNDSSYVTAASSATHVFHTSTSAYTNFHTNPFKILDVTDTANIKVRFYSFADNTATQMVGSSTTNETCVYFIKLGAT